MSNRLCLWQLGNSANCQGELTATIAAKLRHTSPQVVFYETLVLAASLTCPTLVCSARRWHGWLSRSSNQLVESEPKIGNGVAIL